MEPAVRRSGSLIQGGRKSGEAIIASGKKRPAGHASGPSQHGRPSGARTLLHCDAALLSTALLIDPKRTDPFDPEPVNGSAPQKGDVFQIADRPGILLTTRAATALE